MIWMALACTDSTLGQYGGAKTVVERLDSDLLAQEPALQSVLEGDGRVEEGATGDVALRLQQALYDLGVLNTIDGKFGSGTAAAVSAVQEQVGLDATGVVDRDTLAALDDAHARFAARRFYRSAVFAQIAAGDAVLADGSTDEVAVEIVQATLESAGFSVGASWIDGDFGSGTTQALMAFQESKGLDPTGMVDGPTLGALDNEARAQLDAARASSLPSGSKHGQYRVWADISDRVGDMSNEPMILWVVDKTTGDPVIAYMTSPGRSGRETQGDGFYVMQTMPREWWWSASGSGSRPPGVDNPMGILKLHWLTHFQAIHGTPVEAWDDLGGPASAGCLRLSGLNILHIHERYAEAGTWTDINRDSTLGEAMLTRGEALGVPLVDMMDGSELIGAYVGAELGRDEFYNNNDGYWSRLDPDLFRHM